MHEATGIAALGIDWKILVAQLINFAIIFWLLKRFAFGPVTKILEERRQRVEKSIDTASEIEKEKIDIEAKSKEIMQKAQKEAQEIVVAAKTSIKEEQNKIRSQADEQAAKLLKEAKEQIDQMKRDSKKELAQEIGFLVAAATQKVVSSDLDKTEKNKIAQNVSESIKNDR
jgi:F-type H+-transporting ATPase subunit b